MALATVTFKEQVAIPKKVREALKVRTGDKIDIKMIKEGETVIQPVSRKAGALFLSLKRPGTKRLSTEEMDRAVRNGIRKKFSEGS